MKLLAGKVHDLFFGPADPRAYALVRTSFAAVALLNLIDLWPDRHAFFSSAGLIDLETLRRNTAGAPYVSVFYWIQEPAGVTAVFIIAAIALIALGCGYATRLCAIIAWLWQCSYVTRAFPAMHGWDVLLRIIAFVLMVSPSDRIWRLDSLWNRKTIQSVDSISDQKFVPRYGLVLLQVQLAVVYWHTVWLKVDDSFWRDGEFISFFMMSMYSRFPNFHWENWQLLSNVLTYGTLVTELAIPLLLWNRRCRWLGFVLGIFLHGGIWFMSSLWLFSLTIMIPYFAFLEPQDFQSLRLLIRGDSRTSLGTDIEEISRPKSPGPRSGKSP